LFFKVSDEDINKYIAYFEEQLDKKVLAVSAVSGKNVDKLKNLMLKALGME